jgi:hypothetical protein
MRKSLYGLIALICLAALWLQCGEQGETGPEVPAYGVTPDSVSLEVSSTQQFEVIFEGDPAEVTWYVDGLRGGSPEVGMITPTGLFVAPPQVPEGDYVTVSAEIGGVFRADESATVLVESGYGATFIEVDPDTVTVALGDSVRFSASPSGCPLDDSGWSVLDLFPSSAETGEIRPDGTYLAPWEGSSDRTLMVMVAAADCPGKVGLGEVFIEAPEAFKVQFENFTNSYGTGIDGTVACSGGYAVTGLDTAGEWIEVPYEAPANGTYASRIHFQAGYRDTLRLVLTEGECVPSPPADIDFELVGEGKG